MKKKKRITIMLNTTKEKRYFQLIYDTMLFYPIVFIHLLEELF